MNISFNFIKFNRIRITACLTAAKHYRRTRLLALILKFKHEDLHQSTQYDQKFVDTWHNMYVLSEHSIQDWAYICIYNKLQTSAGNFWPFSSKSTERRWGLRCSQCPSSFQCYSVGLRSEHYEDTLHSEDLHFNQFVHRGIALGHLVKGNCKAIAYKSCVPNCMLVHFNTIV